MVDTTIETLMIKLIGDATDYDSKITKSKDTTVSSAAAMGKAMKEATAQVADSSTKSAAVVAAKATETGNAMAGMASKVSKSLAGSKEDTRSWTSTLTQALGGIVKLATGIKDLSLMGLWVSFRQGIKDAVDLDVQARRVGASVLDLRAGALWSGASMQAFSGALATTNAKLADLSGGVVTTSRDFKNLAAISGVAVEELSKGWPTIYDAIASIEDPTVRAGQAFRFLGGNAAEFLGALDRGGAAKTKDIAKGFGLELGNADIENMRTIQGFMRSLEGMQAGVFNQVLAGLSPVLAQLTEMFDLSKVNLEFIKPLVLDITLGIGKFGAQVLAVVTNLDTLKNAFETMKWGVKALAAEFKSSMLTAIAEVLRATIPLQKWMGDAGKGAEENAKWARLEAEGAADAAKWLAEQVGKDINKSDIMAKWRKLEDDIRARADNAAAGPRESKSPVAVDKLVQSFAAMSQSLLGPIDNWRKGIAEMGQYQDLKFFNGAAGEEQKQLMGAKLFNELKSGVGMGNTIALAGAAEGNTREAYSAVAQYSMLGQRGNVQDQIKAALELGNQQREALKVVGQGMLDHLEEIARKELEALEEVNI